MKISKFILICALAFSFASYAPATAGMDSQDVLGQEQQEVGSIDQYNREKDWDSDSEYQIPLIGISVRKALGKLAGGQPLRGLGVIAVKGGSAADAAGVHGERVALQTTLVGVFFAASVVFPPAILGAVVVAASGLGEPRDLIIAVDGTRTRDVLEFENAIGRADAGEIVYLTIVRDGRRQQLRVSLTGDAPRADF